MGDEPTDKPTNDSETKAWRDFELDQEFATFKARGAALLRDEGIKGNDPRLLAAFKRHAKQGDTGNFVLALNRAVADIHKAEARAARESRNGAIEKAREDERAAIKKERERRFGPDDPKAAEPAPTDWSKASDQEVLAETKRRSERLNRLRISQY